MVEEPPDTERLYVPLRDAGCGVSLRLFRDRDEVRCAVGFTSPDRLRAVLGRGQKYYRLTRRSVRELAEERGVTRLIVDPGLVAAPVAADAGLERVPAARTHRIRALLPDRDTQAAGILAVSALTGAAALAVQVLK